MASINKASDEKLRDMYLVELLSIPQIAKKITVTYSTARGLLIKAGIQLRSRTQGVKIAGSRCADHLRGVPRSFTEEHRLKATSGLRSHHAKNAVGVSIRKSGTKSGYVYFTTGKNARRAVHIVVMDDLLGRALAPGECVHHVDQNRSNNDPINLRLMSRSDHAALHRALEKGVTNGLT